MTNINMKIYCVQLGGGESKKSNIPFPMIITLTNIYIWLIPDKNKITDASMVPLLL